MQVSRAIRALWAVILIQASCELGGGVGPIDRPPPIGMTDEVPLKVRLSCPGSPGCEGSGDGKLYVGASAKDITPAVEPFVDDNGNGVWDAGEPFEDRNGNKVFDPYWIAGFGLGRIAKGVHDPVWARALAMRKNQTTVVLVAVDTLGLFYDERAEIEKLLPKDLGIDLLLLHATHVHETADLTGGWGLSPIHWGVTEPYQQLVRRAIVSSITEALRNLRPARVTFGSVAVEDQNRDMKQYVVDSRDPVVIDNVLHTLQFSSDTAPHAPIATLINWGNHPEAAGGDNQLISSDFVHYVRERVEARAGGIAVYVTGAVGGLMTPLSAEPLDEDRRPVKQNGFAKAEALGRAVGTFALTAMADPKAMTLDGSKVDLSFQDTVFNAQVHNRKFQLAAMLRTFRRSFCCYDESRPVGEDNAPFVTTQVSYLRLGPAAIITNPGEIFPEFLLGGYGGEYAGTYRFVDKTQANYPDVSKAPAPPYLYDLMGGERAHRMTFGLTGDFVGYIMPRYTFLLDEKSPYLKDAPGDHYEETNSLGPLADPQIVGTMRQLIQKVEGRR